MATYIVQKGDYAGKIAQAMTGDARRWTELCAANPQLKKDAKAGCVMFAGNAINLPASWGQGSVTSSSIAMPLLPDGRPVAELVPASVPSSSPSSQASASRPPTVLTVGKGSALSPDVVPAAATVAPSGGGSSLLKWGLIGGSVVAVGGVVAWLLLRGGGEPTARPNGAVDWVKHKLGLRGEEKPRANRGRFRKGKGKRRSK